MLSKKIFALIGCCATALVGNAGAFFVPNILSTAKTEMPFFLGSAACTGLTLGVAHELYKKVAPYWLVPFAVATGIATEKITNAAFKYFDPENKHTKAKNLGSFAACSTALVLWKGQRNTDDFLNHNPAEQLYEHNQKALNAIQRNSVRIEVSKKIDEIYSRYK